VTAIDDRDIAHLLYCDDPCPNEDECVAQRVAQASQHVVYISKWVTDAAMRASAIPDVTAIRVTEPEPVGDDEWVRPEPERLYPRRVLPVLCGVVVAALFAWAIFGGAR
jgi:hypothetical protein